ncbi:MAG: outer membrane beta-barrel domain-containing protein [Deltaproteobacteria bacterium]|nr:outer membrane beta-barrel domain-containing protein [Deltaproteobacteria bacterium]
MAQGKGAKPKEAAAAAGAKPKEATVAGDAKPGDAKGGGAAAQPTEIDADAPPPGETPKEGSEPPPKEEGGLDAICKLDPEACPNIDLVQAAKRDIKAQMYAVQQIYALRARRFEIQPYWGLTMNDQFVSHPGFGLGLNYWLTNVMAIGVNGNWYAGLNSDSQFNASTRRAVRVGVPLNEYQWGAAANFTYVPMYGKFAGFGDFIFHWDAYVVGGVGVLSTRPIVIFDPRYRNYSYEPKLAFNAGIGIRIFFNRWFAGIVEVRDYIYNEKLENIQDVDAQTDQWRQDKANWLGDSKLTNNVQLQAGVSIFLPFSWEYRLPK